MCTSKNEDDGICVDMMGHSCVLPARQDDNVLTMRLTFANAVEAVGRMRSHMCWSGLYVEVGRSELMRTEINLPNPLCQAAMWLSQMWWMQSPFEAQR